MTQPPASADDIATILRNAVEDRPIHANAPTTNAILRVVQELLLARTRIQELETAATMKESPGAADPA